MAPPGVTACDWLGQTRGPNCLGFILAVPREEPLSSPPIITPYCIGLAATVDSAALIDAEPGLCSQVFDAELGLCRLDEELSAFYGHRIYLCKRLENVVPA